MTELLEKAFATASWLPHQEQDALAQWLLELLKCLDTLPVVIRQKAREAYILFRQNPHHSSLQFKQVHP